MTEFVGSTGDFSPPLAVGSSRKTAEAIANSMKRHREDWEDHYRELEDYLQPRRGLFNGGAPADRQRSKRGKKVNHKMLDSTPMRALRVLKSGMQSGMTNPARRWFRWTPADREKREFHTVKEFLAKAEDEAQALLRTGFYRAFHTSYGDLGTYGHEAAIIEDHPTKLLRITQLVPGSFWMGSMDGDVVDILYREPLLTVNEIVGRFVFGNNLDGTPDWNAVTADVKRCFDAGDGSKQRTVKQLIHPRFDFDPRSKRKQDRPIASLYWMDDLKGDRYMDDSGFKENPISASRWETVGNEVYSRSPGMEALPDIKELMDKRRDFAEMLKRVNRPPMNAPVSLRSSAFSLLPDAVNFLADPNQGIKPAYQIDPRFGELRQDIESSKNDVWAAMYADLFLMISSLDRRQITATEIGERVEEKLIAIGPVVDRLGSEKHEPMLDRIFNKLLLSGRLGTPPPELESETLEVDFISMLAQAQRAVATGAVERLWSFAGNLGAVKPDILDKLDEDQTIEEYADMLGTSPSLLRSDDEVQAIRASRQQIQQAMQAADSAAKLAPAVNQATQAAETLSRADQPRGNQPADILRRVGIG